MRIGWIIFDVIVGAIAKLLMPGRDPGGIVVTILLGVSGAVIGGAVGRGLGFYGPADSAGFVMAMFGSVLLLWIYRQVCSRTT
ncbi:MAG: GlsB/YeaQ/YmgE family stress response membrane protein [Candidatus Binatia bacterium]